MVNLHASPNTHTTKQCTAHFSPLEKHVNISDYNTSDKRSDSQLDGSGDYYSHLQSKQVRNNFMQPPQPRAQTQQPQIQDRSRQAHLHTASQPFPRQQLRPPESAVTDILPYCTTEPPLLQEQVIALSDVAGSIRELVLLALGATVGDAGCAEKMEGAVGATTMGSVVEFFAEEWEVE
jgi:hypothetical protein